MKQYQTTLVIIALVLLGFVLGGFTKPFDNTNNDEPKTVPAELLRSYQIQIVDDDQLVMYDGIRYVGSFKFNGKCRLDKMIMADNE